MSINKTKQLVLLLGDANGAVAVPYGRAEEILPVTGSIQATEDETRADAGRHHLQTSSA